MTLKEISNELIIIHPEITENFIKSKISSGWINYHGILLKYWKDIQKMLPKGRICPSCGKIIIKGLGAHLRKHNITQEEWYCMLNNIKITEHRCPNCTKLIKFVNNHYYYPEFCCDKCRLEYLGNPMAPGSWNELQIIHNGYSGKSDPKYVERLKLKSIQCTRNIIFTNNKYGSSFYPSSWTDEQLKNRNLSRDSELYKSLLLRNSINCSKAGKINKEKNGFNWQPGTWTDDQIKRRELLGRSDPNYIKLIKDRSELSRRTAISVIKKYNYSYYNPVGYKSVFLFNSDKLNLDSHQELFFLLKKVYIDNIDPLRIKSHVFYENTTNEFSGISAMSDLEIDYGSHKTNYEIHDIRDKESINRKRFCTELNKVKFILVNVDDCTYPFGSIIHELKQFGLDTDKIYSELVEANHDHKIYKYNYELITRNSN